MDSSRKLDGVPKSDSAQVLLSSSQGVPSSPPSVVSDAGPHRKIKRPPPVTPRSFKRFFTPRSALNGAGNAGSVRTNRQALKELSSTSLNRQGPAFTKAKADKEGSGTLKAPSFELLKTPNRKRKLSFSSIDSPLESSPSRKVHVSKIRGDEKEDPTADTIQLDHVWNELHSSPKTATSRDETPVNPIRRSKVLAGPGELCLRNISGRMNRSILRTTYGSDWRDQTSNFYTQPQDMHACLSVSGDQPVLPFCTASCNTNSLIAIGDDEGGIRLLDSAKEDKQGFSTAYLTFRPHGNAIMDLEFSSDDLLLATAAGDQTSLILDMNTQKPIYCLSNHVSSVKRVQFQPASNNRVVATCSRDGNVNIWDLRCKGYDQPAMQLRCSLAPDSDNGAGVQSQKLKYPPPVNTIHGAHVSVPRTSTAEPQTARADVTVTSLAFLPPGRENLFVTASEANACVKLWDLRTAYNVRRGRPTPVSTTREPECHKRHRAFGVTSMVMSGDGSRLYTLCRDASVYAYSTSHLIVGSAPELALNNTRPRRTGGPDKEGLGPLYGFRHPRLQVSTFYVKTAIRPARDDRCELLAVGSSDNCAIIFPTDEKLLTKSSSKNSSDLPTPRSRLVRRTSSGVGRFMDDTVPIYQTGTALVGAHKKEVSAVSWTERGELITVSDDYSARCWREGPEARDLRARDENDGRRWDCGWADMSDSYDDDDE